MLRVICMAIIMSSCLQNAPDTLCCTTFRSNRPTNEPGFGITQGNETRSSIDLNTNSTARVQTSPLVIGRTVGASSVSTSSTSLTSLLLELSLILLDILGLTLALLVQLLVLGLDLGVTVFGLCAAAAGTGCES
jgi:hypothetical protein